MLLAGNSLPLCRFPVDLSFSNRARDGGRHCSPSEALRAVLCVEEEERRKEKRKKLPPPSKMPTCTLEDPVCADVALVEIFAAVSSAPADELLYKMNSSFSGVCLGCYRRPVHEGEKESSAGRAGIYLFCGSLEVQFSEFNKYVYVISIKIKNKNLPNWCRRVYEKPCM